MSDETTTTTTTPTPADNGGTQPNAGQGAQAPQAGQEPAQTPANEPFAIFPTEQAFRQRLSREARKEMNTFAKQAGFDDWTHLSETLATLRQGANDQEQPAQGAQAQPEQAQAQQQQQGPNEAERLRMALQVGAKLNLPAALVARLQGNTPEAMESDAQQLLSLMGTGAQRAGIPPVPQSQQPTTFTRQQLQDPAFVRANKDAIMRAAAEGRIVNS